MVHLNLIENILQHANFYPRVIVITESYAEMVNFSRRWAAIRVVIVFWQDVDIVEHDTVIFPHLACLHKSYILQHASVKFGLTHLNKEIIFLEKLQNAA